MFSHLTFNLGTNPVCL